MLAEAGAGKTSTIVRMVAALSAEDMPIPWRMLVLAFNRDMAEELRERLPVTVDVHTVHALGWSLCRRATEGC